MTNRCTLDRRRGAATLFALALLVAPACSDGSGGSSSGGVPGPSRSAAGVLGKPVVVTPTGPALADERLVQFEPGTDPELVATALDEVRADVVWRAPATGYVVVRFADPAAADRGAADLHARPEVRRVDVNKVLTGSGDPEGNGISTSPVTDPPALQWNLHAMGLSPDGIWGDGGGIRVAVLDSGVAYEDHADASGVYALAPDLGGIPFASGYDFINDDPHPNDDQGHGTHVAGVIAAQQGIVSLAPAVEIMPVKVLDESNTGTELALAEGIFYAVDHGADVINMSLSFPPSFFPSRYLQEAIDYAADEGVVMIAASGNHGAGMVTYPAAFREVVAVGASRLSGGGFWWWLPYSWPMAEWRQRPAPYSNGGYLVDVVAPAGVIDGDVNGDGFPEAVLGQSFAGDPTDFDYYFYAGTSQAAAEVSGIAAVMLGANPELSPRQLRGLLGETASLRGLFLDESIGRGYLRADHAIGAATGSGATEDRPRYSTALHVSLHRQGNHRRALAEVEVLDAAGAPAPHTVVYGSFTGGVYDSVVGVTDGSGRTRFWSSRLDGEGALIAFQVDAVTGLGGQEDFDRPRGALHVDSCSLELLAAYASGQGISTSPGPVPLALRAPIVRAQQIPSYTLLNYSWSLSSVPMAVAVDAEWFDQTFTESSYGRVQSQGSGISTSPIVVDPELSFPQPVSLLAYAQGAPAECVDVEVHTFLGGPDDDSPVVSNPAGDCVQADSCAAFDDVLGEMWGFFSGQGISTSPVWEPGDGVSPEAHEHLFNMMDLYVEFGFGEVSSPVGSYGAVLDAAGLGLTPLPDGTGVGAGSAAMD